MNCLVVAEIFLSLQPKTMWEVCKTSLWTYRSETDNVTQTCQILIEILSLIETWFFIPTLYYLAFGTANPLHVTGFVFLVHRTHSLRSIDVDSVVHQSLSQIFVDFNVEIIHH